MSNPWMPPSIRGPIVVERHDDDDGTINYELWDHGGAKYHCVCTVTDSFNDNAKAEAEFIALAMNNAIGALTAIHAATCPGPPVPCKESFDKSPDSAPEPPAAIDHAALQAAREIIALSESWTYTQRRAAIQVIIAREMMRARRCVSFSQAQSPGSIETGQRGSTDVFQKPSS